MENRKIKIATWQINDNPVCIIISSAFPLCGISSDMSLDFPYAIISK